MYFIYLIRCSVTKLPIYVGSTINPEQRYMSHLCSGNEVTEYYKKIGAKPIMEIIQKIETDHLKHEYYWISEIRKTGIKLFNRLPSSQKSWDKYWDLDKYNERQKDWHKNRDILLEAIGKLKKGKSTKKKEKDIPPRQKNWRKNYDTLLEAIKTLIPRQG